MPTDALSITGAGVTEGAGGAAVAVFAEAFALVAESVARAPPGSHNAIKTRMKNSVKRFPDFVSTAHP